MKLLNAAAAASMAAAVLCVTACGGHSGGSGLSILPQPQDGSRSAKLGPAPMQTFAPSPFMVNTSDGIHALQVFDQYSSRIITSEQGIADGLRYASIWGVRNPRMASAWHTNNTRLNTLLYTPYDTDATGSGLDQPTGWWLAFHPDWILYECNKKSIAFVPGLPGVPLDISNPAVSQYQAGLLGSFAEEHGYDGVAADIVSLKNNTGGAKSGRGGCGVWTNGHSTWVAKFSGEAIDPKWATATENWVSSMHNALHDRTVFARPLALAVNTNIDAYLPPTKFLAGGSGEQTVVANADIILNEAGFAMWGHYVSDRGFNNAVGWMEYAQSLGEAVLTTDDWNEQSQEPTKSQLIYSIATYLMGKEQAAALYVGQSGMYGKENYYPEYDAKIGQACAAMYGGPSDPYFLGKNLYLRKYSGGLAIVNVNAKSAYDVILPKHSYRNIEGGKIASPLTIQPNSGFVLLTSGGCD
jgi:hypothetical protein